MKLYRITLSDRCYVVAEDIGKALEWGKEHYPEGRVGAYSAGDVPECDRWEKHDAPKCPECERTNTYVNELAAFIEKKFPHDEYTHEHACKRAIEIMTDEWGGIG